MVLQSPPLCEKIMGYLEDHKPAMAMFAFQFAYAGMALSTRAVLTEGMSPKVFVVYRQAIATIVMAPIAYFARRRKTSIVPLGRKSFCMMFVASLVGITINQNCYFQGMYFTSSSMASAMGNLLPAITFLMAACFRLERVSIRSWRSMAKVFGTIVCVVGAVAMTLLKGPKLFNAESLPQNSIFLSGGENWMLGCLLLLGNNCCWSFWLILQVPMSDSYPDHLSLSAWMCFLSTLQSGTLAFFIEPDLGAWKLNSSLKFLSCFYAGIVGSGMSFYVQSWCISRRGPLFSAMFSPISTVIVTFLACLILHEKLYAGSLAGAVAIVVGLYAVLWGKAKDLDFKIDANPSEESIKINGSVDETLVICKVDIKEPLLAGLDDLDETELKL
ncbi:WAT1-related protein At4g30420-like [Tasmannia lanceolata]|uniref:WAT1-related protein At4g30420-like n=1 Tax=Tasmannia lanceolata TaxID=3420 RepID=UPI00406404EC